MESQCQYEQEGRRTKEKNTQMPEPMKTPVLNSHVMIPQDSQKAKGLNKHRERDGQRDAVRERKAGWKGGEGKRGEEGNDKEGGVGSCWFALGATEARSVLYKLQPCQIKSASPPAPYSPSTHRQEHTHTHAHKLIRQHIRSTYMSVHKP